MSERSEIISVKMGVNFDTLLNIVCNTIDSPCEIYHIHLKIRDIE